MESLLKKQIIQASQIDLSQDQLTYLQSRDLLDNQFAFFLNVLEIIAKLSVTFKGTEFEWVDLLERARENINQQQNRILKFYEQFFPDGVIVGAFKEPESPDVIVVLGANPPLIEQRAEYAGKLAKQYPDIPIVASGGGFNVKETEAERICKILALEGISSDRIILESDSMDTIGNAFFTKLALKERNLLKKELKILVVTSKFHASRSLRYFKRVFSSRYRVAVSCVVTLGDKGRIALSHHELLSEYTAQHSLFFFETGDYLKSEVAQAAAVPTQGSESDGLMYQNPTNLSLDDQTLLFQLLHKHDLYKNRCDLWRKFFLLSSDESVT